MARLKEVAARKNPSASKEAQEIFDAISRTLPTKWAGTSIVVNETVVIASPYRAENCKAGPGQQPGALARVKIVVSFFRVRLSVLNPFADLDVLGPTALIFAMLTGKRSKMLTVMDSYHSWKTREKS